MTNEFRLKRRKTQEKDDKISSLPDDLLCHILSFLPTKHAVATTVLSTRWKCLFASVPDLDFDDSLTCSRASDVTSFCNFVSNVIRTVLNKSTCIRKFSLVCERGIYDASLVYSWIYAVSFRDLLQDFIVSVSNLTYHMPLPLQLFKCTTLGILKLSGRFSLTVPNYVFFPSLKTLHLSELLLIDDKSVRRLFHGCIVLEELRLLNCAVHTIRNLEVSGASLKILYLYKMNGDYKFLLDAPCLEFFHCGSYPARGYFGDTLKSLVTAHINIEFEDGNFRDAKVSQLVNMVSNVRSLAFSGDSLGTFLNQSTTFPKLTKLWVDTSWAGGWFSLPNLLDKAPRLQVLNFDDGFCDEDGNFIDAAFCLPEHVPACVCDRLKKVVVSDFHGEEDEFKMVEYFLKYCKVLEKMTITPYLEKRDGCSGGPIFDTEQHVPIYNRLLKLPRYSGACRIVFASEELYYH